MIHIIARTAAAIRNQKHTYTTLRKNWVYAVCARSTYAACIGTGIILTAKYSSLPPLVPLWYSKMWGEARLAEPFWLYGILFSACFLHFLNIILSLTLLKPYRIFIQLLFLSSTSVALLLSFSVIKILFLVT